MNVKNEKRFIVDFMLSRLSRWLRTLGFDTLYTKDTNNASLILKSLQENRIIITMDHKLSAKKAWGIVLIKSGKIGDQIKQVLKELQISVYYDNLFTRCTVCNGLIANVNNKETVKDLVPEYIFKTHNEFSKCNSCGKLYWTGSHRQLFLNDLKKAGIKF